jgi:hypothetical protein
MKAVPSLHDFLRSSHVSLEMLTSLSAESSAVKNLFGRRVTRVNKTCLKTPDSTDHTLLLCGVFKIKHGNLSRVCGSCNLLGHPLTSPLVGRLRLTSNLL